METLIKGSVLRARRAFVDKQFGGGAWPRLLESLGAEDRSVLGRVTSAGWYPFDLGERLDAAIVGVLGGGRADVFERIGAQSARENLTGVHRDFVKPGDPLGFMARAAAIYRLYYDHGRRAFEPTGPCSGVLTTFDASDFSRADCLTVVGWHREALGMCGAVDADIREEACRARGDDRCSYRMSWRLA